MRLDVYLKAARLFKRRAEAQKNIDAGRVLLNGHVTKPAHPVNPGDRLQILYPRWEVQIEVIETPGRAVPRAEAETLYRLVARTPRDPR